MQCCHAYQALKQANLRYLIDQASPFTYAFDQAPRLFYSFWQNVVSTLASSDYVPCSAQIATECAFLLKCRITLHFATYGVPLTYASVKYSPNAFLETFLYFTILISGGWER